MRHPILHHEDAPVLDHAGRHEQRGLRDPHDDIHLHRHPDRERRVVGQIETHAIGLADRVAHGRHTADGGLQWSAREGVRAQEGALARLNPRDVLLVHLRYDPERPRATDPEQHRSGLGDLPDLAVLP